MTSTQEFYYVGLLLLGVFATYATVGLIFWLFHSHQLGHHLKLLTDISPQMAAIIGLLFGLYMAFFANDIWSIRDRAQTMILQEADGLRGILEIAESTPTAGAPLVTAVRGYVQAAVGEWTLLGQGKSSQEARQRLRQVSQLALGEPLASHLTPAAQFALVQNLRQMQSARYTRLELTHRRGDPLKWFAVACLGTLTLLTLALVHLDNWRTQLAAMLIYASAISVGFTAAYLERSPFQVFVISSRPLAELLNPPP